jgi:pyruvate ferredoxin oxidoreductase beta subunit
MPKRINLKELSDQKEQLAPGHRLCPGCGEPIVVRQVLHAIEGPVVIANATGCLEVSTTPYPYTSWRVPWIHSAFENAAATISGVEAMHRSLVRQGKYKDGPITFVAFAGDGGTYDIGLQSLSGALERGHKFLYVCLNNEAYMNTGIQRSSATPVGASTTTSPAGSVIPGKRGQRKDLTAIIAAHNVPYVAQVSPHAWRDLMTKVQKAVAADGPSFINALAACPRGWRSEPEDSVALGKLAVDTRVWPLFEVENGNWKITARPRNKLPVEEWLKTQGRFKHLQRPENKEVVETIQAEVDQRWEELLERCGVT